MKSVEIKTIKHLIRCDFYMCNRMAQHSIATKDSPPGQCFRICEEHFEGLKGAFETLLDPGSVDEVLVEMKDEVIDVVPAVDPLLVIEEKIQKIDEEIAVPAANVLQKPGAVKPVTQNPFRQGR